MPDDTKIISIRISKATKQKIRDIAYRNEETTKVLIDAEHTK